MQTPNPCSPATYQDATPITPGTEVRPGFGFRIACQSAGYFVLRTLNGGLYTYYANVGTSGEDGISIKGVSTAGVPSPAGVGTVTVLR